MAILLYDSRKGNYPASDPIINSNDDSLFPRKSENFQDLDSEPNNRKLSNSNQQLVKGWVSKNVSNIVNTSGIFHNRNFDTAFGFKTNYQQSSKAGVLVGSHINPEASDKKRWCSPHGMAFKMKYNNSWSNRINQRVSDLGILYIHVLNNSRHFGEIIINGSIPGRKLNTGFNINEYGKPTSEAYFRGELDPADKAVLDANPNLYKMIGFYIVVQQQNYDGASHEKLFRFCDIKFLFDPFFDRPDNVRHVLPASENLSNVKDQYIDGYIRID